LAILQRFAGDHANAPLKEPKEISGTKFQGAEIGGVGLGHQFSGTYCHGFSAGSCYEIDYGLATAGYGAVDGMKRVNRAEVFSILENILATLRLSRPQPSRTHNEH
jgi:hypothetical protein